MNTKIPIIYVLGLPRLRHRASYLRLDDKAYLHRMSDSFGIDTPADLRLNVHLLLTKEQNQINLENQNRFLVMIATDLTGDDFSEEDQEMCKALWDAFPPDRRLLSADEGSSPLLIEALGKKAAADIQKCDHSIESVAKNFILKVIEAEPVVSPTQNTKEKPAPKTKEASKAKSKTAEKPATDQAAPSAPKLPETLPDDFDVSAYVDTLSELVAIEGATAIALVDVNKKMLLEHHGANLNWNVAALGISEFMQESYKTIEASGVDDGLQNIIISLGNAYHILQPAKNNPAYFYYMVFDRSKDLLASILSQIEKIFAKA